MQPGADEAQRSEIAALLGALTAVRRRTLETIVRLFAEVRFCDWARPRPHLHRDWAHPAHICTGTGLAPTAHVRTHARARARTSTRADLSSLRASAEGLRAAQHTQVEELHDKNQMTADNLAKVAQRRACAGLQRCGIALVQRRILRPLPVYI